MTAQAQSDRPARTCTTSWRTRVAHAILLPALGYLFDKPATYHHQRLIEARYCLAQDGQQVLTGLTLDRHVRYGAHPDEIMHILSPQPLLSHSRALIFVHGGGWCMTNAQLSLHYLSPYVRQGFTVYTIDFPQAPAHRFPIAVASVLRALLFVRQHSGCAEVQLAGESCGGNLCTLVAALLVPANRSLLQRLWGLYKATEISGTRHSGGIEDSQVEAAVVAVDGSALQLPRVDRVCSMYGVLDQNSWKIHPFFGAMLTFFIKAYRSHHPTASSMPLCILDIRTAQLAGFPPSLMICGDADALVESSVLAAEHLKAAGCDSSNVTVEGGFHGYLGIPAAVEFVGCKLSVVSSHTRVIDFMCQSQSNSLSCSQQANPLAPNSSRYIFWVSVVMCFDLLFTCLVIFPLHLFYFLFTLPFTRKFWRDFNEDRTRDQILHETANNRDGNK